MKLKEQEPVQMFYGCCSGLHNCSWAQKRKLTEIQNMKQNHITNISCVKFKLANVNAHPILDHLSHLLYQREVLLGYPSLLV